MWYLISYAHNDLNYDSVNGISLHEGEMTCVAGAKNFAEFFLLSFEIQVNRILSIFPLKNRWTVFLYRKFRPLLDSVNVIQMKSAQRQFSSL